MYIYTVYPHLYIYIYTIYFGVSPFMENPYV